MPPVTSDALVRAAHAEPFCVYAFLRELARIPVWPPTDDGQEKEKTMQDIPAGDPQGA